MYKVRHSSSTEELRSPVDVGDNDGLGGLEESQVF